MTVNEIIEQLYNSKDVDDCIRKMVRVDHRDDFKQELFLKIYEIPSERLIGLYERNELKFYIVRTLINLVKNNGSIYNKIYINHEKITVYQDEHADTIDETDISQRLIKEEKEKQLLVEIEFGLEEAFNTPYYKALVHLIAEMGSMREVSRKTGIPIASISEAVKKTRNYLTNKVYNGEPIKRVY